MPFQSQQSNLLGEIGSAIEDIDESSNSSKFETINETEKLPGDTISGQYTGKNAPIEQVSISNLVADTPLL